MRVCVPPEVAVLPSWKDSVIQKCSRPWSNRTRLFTRRVQKYSTTGYADVSKVNVVRQNGSTLCAAHRLEPTTSATMMFGRMRPTSNGWTFGLHSSGLKKNRKGRLGFRLYSLAFPGWEHHAPATQKKSINAMYGEMSISEWSPWAGSCCRTLCIQASWLTVGKTTAKSVFMQAHDLAALAIEENVVSLVVLSSSLRSRGIRPDYSGSGLQTTVKKSAISASLSCLRFIQQTLDETCWWLLDWTI